MNLFSFILPLILFISSCATFEEAPIHPPKAAKKDKKLTKFGDVRQDPYYWMRERDTPEILDYLKKENKYTEQVFKPMQGLQEDLFEEMKGRDKKEDQSVPVKVGEYYYYTRYEKKSEYAIVCRKKSSLKNKEEIVLNANEVAKGKPFFNLGSWAVTSDHRYLAFATDTVGRRLYDISFKDLKTGRTLSHKIENVTGELTWAEDNKTLFYSKQNPQTLRFEWIYSFNLESAKPNLVYHEKDEKFYASVSKTRSKKYIVIDTNSSESSEVWLINALNPNQKPRLFSKRRAKHEYSVDHAGSFFYVLTNKKAVNFRVMRTPSETKTDEKSWKPVVPHRASTLVEDLDVFENHVVFSVVQKGVPELEIFNRKTGKRSLMPQPEKSHSVSVYSNPEYRTKNFMYVYNSLTTPPTVIDIDFSTKKKTVKKVKEVLGGFDQKNYVSERIDIKAHDGVRIPVSIVYRKGFKKDGQSPLLLYGYGSYGYSIPPSFNASRLSLLDRGFAYAIAHIRGSSTLGRSWYLNGKYLKKKNTFKDYVSVAEGLIKRQYTSKEHLYAMGQSAGGLLMGAVSNMRPDLFHGMVAGVPFVDVLTTMLDDTIPLTTNEYEEWGNPNKKTYYTYMKSYSPYDNVKKQAYPNIFVSSGYHDSQVQYWEPTKWVAKLRDHNTGDSKILLYTDLEAGHSGKSGRFKKYEDVAKDYAFLIHLERNRTL